MSIFFSCCIIISIFDGTLDIEQFSVIELSLNKLICLLYYLLLVPRGIMRYVEETNCFYVPLNIECLVEEIVLLRHILFGITCIF